MSVLCILNASLLIQRKTSSCVPNTHDIQILAPIWQPDICPDGSESWEIRTKSLGCHCSTITLLTCIISVLSTFVVIGFVAMGGKAARGLQDLWATRADEWWKVWRHYKPGWWKIWNTRKSDTDPIDVEAPEQRPLLERE